MAKIQGVAVAVFAAGSLFAFSGLKGVSVLQSIQWIVSGKNPESIPQSTGISVPAMAASASSGGSAAATPVSASAAQNQATAKMLAISMGHSDWTTGQQWSDWVALWNQESGWSATATNPSSGAFGIPQALPADKMASAGSDWKTNATTQIRWGITYIAGRYGNPSAAMAHERANNWY